MIERPILDPEEVRRAVFESSNSKAVHLSEWNERLHSDFEVIEREAFRDELRYSFEEMVQRSRCAGFEGLLLYLDEVPAAIVVIYDIASSEENEVYLDTIAVRTPGLGIGSRLLDLLLSRCELARVSAVVLDTERSTERGFRLVEFYEKFGFEVVSEDVKGGNITMRCNLSNREERPSPPPPVE